MLGLCKSSRGLLKRRVLRDSKIELVFLPSFLPSPYLYVKIYAWLSSLSLTFIYDPKFPEHTR